ncbi:pyridoxal phosphate-dependent decarboxylase family protein [Roseobacter sp. S98]|uniref:pyridoxal phosphate-dependent decarboxylase family protein n=1 Tax=Roseobacter algicola (ex Choi et al. 2025) (nom. illeg.) TaxID=3092138 RepID=UPI0035C6C1C4
MTRAPLSDDLLRELGQYHLRDKSRELGLNRPGSQVPETWFLGPKAENQQMMSDLIGQALEGNYLFRQEYAPHDPPIFTPEDIDTKSAPDRPRAEAYHRSRALLHERLDELTRYLKGSIPLASYRNQSHMYWDVSLPGVVGYIAALLYNQNNVAAEASPVTTMLEIKVCDDLCRMLGYHIPNQTQIRDGALKPWGHITCDGSVANAESIWAARNAKYLPVALAAAIRTEGVMAPARNLTVRLLDGKRRRLLDLDAWQLLNLPLDEVIGLTPRITKATGIATEVITGVLAEYSVQSVGLVEFHRRFLPDTPPPVLLAPSPAHYSWPKGLALVGSGRNAMRVIRVDLDARMCMVDLRATLDQCLAEGQPVMEVVAVIGTTEESAVDPLHDILEIRDEYRQLGMEFSVHADAAWGGYFASMLHEAEVFEDETDVPEFSDTDKAEDDAAEEFRDEVRRIIREDIFTYDGIAAGMHMNDYVMRQYRALGRADTITVDPHKAGFIPYPAGALCYRNGAMRDLIAFTAPVVYHGGMDPTTGVYGIEGSKPGAAAAAVWLSHSVIRTDQSGYGRLLGRCIFNSKRLYAALFEMDADHPTISVTPLQRLPAEKAGGTQYEINAQKQVLARRVAPRSNEQLLEIFRTRPEVFELFREAGSDQSIVTYALNFRTGEGLNTSLDLMNEMNADIFSQLSLQSFNGGHVPHAEMFVTSSEFDPATFGQDFVDHYAQRCGVVPEPGKSLFYLISTTQNPWLTETVHNHKAENGNMLPEVMKALARAAEKSAAKVIRRHGLSMPG